MVSYTLRSTAHHLHKTLLYLELATEVMPFCTAVLLSYFQHKWNSKHTTSMRWHNQKGRNTKGFFGCFFFITQFSSLITHHFKILYPFGTITHLPSLNIFHTVCQPHTRHSVQVFLFFFFPQNPNSPNPKKKKKKKETQKPEPSEKNKKPSQRRPVKEEVKKRTQPT